MSANSQKATFAGTADIFSLGQRRLFGLGCTAILGIVANGPF